MMLSKKNLFIHQVGLKLILYQKTLHVTLENEKGARADGDWRVEERRRHDSHESHDPSLCSAQLDRKLVVSRVCVFSRVVARCPPSSRD